MPPSPTATTTPSGCAVTARSVCDDGLVAACQVLPPLSVNHALLAPMAAPRMASTKATRLAPEGSVSAVRVA